MPQKIVPQKIFHWQDKYLHLSDNELISNYKSSLDKELVACLFGRYTDLLYGLCLKHFKDGDLSMDTVYEVYGIISDKLLNHDVDNFRSWLYRVTCNYCIDKIRKNKIVLIDITANNIAIADLSFDMIDDMKEKEEIFQQISICMQGLNERQRTSIDLFFFQEKSYQDIASSLDISWDQTRSLIQNGKRNLKICMEDNAAAKGGLSKRIN